MPRTIKNKTRGQADPRKKKERLTDEQIIEGFELLRLSHIGQITFTTPNDFARSFKRCSLFEDGFITMKAHTGV